MNDSCDLKPRFPHAHFVNQIDLSSRDKRRKAVALAASLLDRIRAAEQANLDNFPLAFRDSDAFANAELSLDALTDAIVPLGDIY
jgi:hypothetical protein